jgi:hypothetical protein
MFGGGSSDPGGALGGGAFGFFNLCTSVGGGADGGGANGKPNGIAAGNAGNGNGLIASMVLFNGFCKRSGNAPPRADGAVPFTFFSPNAGAGIDGGDMGGGLAGSLDLTGTVFDTFDDSGSGAKDGGGKVGGEVGGDKSGAFDNDSLIDGGKVGGEVGGDKSGAFNNDSSIDGGGGSGAKDGAGKVGFAGSLDLIGTGFNTFSRCGNGLFVP